MAPASLKLNGSRFAQWRPKSINNGATWLAHTRSRGTRKRLRGERLSTHVFPVASNLLTRPFQ